MVKEIGSVLIVGAGAVGAAVGGMIADRDPAAVSVLAGGERMGRYQREGFFLNGTRRDFSLVSPAEHSEVDLAIVAVKTYQLPQAIEDMRNHVGAGDRPSSRSASTRVVRAFTERPSPISGADDQLADPHRQQMSSGIGKAGRAQLVHQLVGLGKVGHRLGEVAIRGAV